MNSYLEYDLITKALVLQYLVSLSFSKVSEINAIAQWVNFTIATLDKTALLDHSAPRMTSLIQSKTIE